MKRLYPALLFSWLLVSLHAMGQPAPFTQLPPVIEWQKSLGGSKADKANTVIRTLDNGYLVVGSSFSNDGQVTGHHGSTDSSDAWVVKLDGAGNLQWQKSFGGTANDYFNHVVQASNGDFLCIGTTESNNGDVSGLHYFSDMWICRITSTGTLLWSRVYGGTDPDRGKVIRRFPGGGFIVAGDAESADGDVTAGNHYGYSDVWLLKINDNGNIQWQKKFGNLNEQYVNDLRVLSDGSFTVTGREVWRGVPNCINLPVYTPGVDFYLKVNPNGNAVWQQYTQVQCGVGSYEYYVYNLLPLPSGELFYLGYSLWTANENYGTWRFKKISPSTGQIRVSLSTNNYITHNLSTPQAPNYTSPNVSTMLPDSNVLTTATYSGSNTSPKLQASVSLISTQDAGTRILFQKSYGGDSIDAFNSVDALNQAEYIVAGYSNSINGDVTGNHGNYDFWVVKLVVRNKITGRVFVDNNGNGVKDPTETYTANIKVTSTKGSQSIASTTNANGLFLNLVDTGSYSTTVNLSWPYYTVNPAAKISNFPGFNAKDSFDFALVPIPNKKDLKITLSGNNALRPGFNMMYQLNYVNEGTENLNAVVKLAISPTLHFLSSTPAQTSIVNDTIIWNIGPLASRAGGSINVTLKADAPPLLNIGDVVKLLGIIEPIAGDETPENNRDTLKQTARGSFDPNDKAENLNGVMTPDQVGNKYLTYTIRFQNTGTDTAFNVIIRDTLEAKLDWSSIEMVKASHNVHTAIKNGNIITWTFTDILLPDSNVNEPASHGYVTYRIKPTSTVAIGDTIRNSASIYFDFNPPVKTITHETLIKLTTLATPAVSGIANNYCSTQGSQKGKIDNLPAQGSGITVSVKLDGNSLAIAADSTFTFDVSALAAGAHAIVVTYSNGSETKTATNNFNVTLAVSPDVNVGANNTTIANLNDPVIITATNASGGGTSPLYTFAKDRSFTNIVQAESASNVFNTTGNNLQTGDNWFYVRMKTSATCFTTQLNIDSIKIVLQLPAPGQPALTGLRTEYCVNEGTQKVKIANYPDPGTGTTVTVKLDGNAVTLNMTDTSFMFTPAVGNHSIVVTYTNPAGTKTTTANFTVTAAVTPDVNLSANGLTLTASNAAGGGTAPTYVFAKDRSFTNILQAEGANAILTLNLNLGENKIYVRMKSSMSCVTVQTAIDSITITRFASTGLIDPDFPNQTIGATPNPFRSRLVISGLSTTKSYTIIIYNQRGAVVNRKKVTGSSSAALYLPAHAAGTYMLSIYDETKKRMIGTMKVVKQ